MSLCSVRASFSGSSSSLVKHSSMPSHLLFLCLLFSPMQSLISEQWFQSSFLFVLSLTPAATSPFEPSSPEQLKPLNEPFYEEPEAPVLSLGERIAWMVGGGTALPEFGVVKWIGRMPQVCRTWTVGVEFVSNLLTVVFQHERSSHLPPVWTQVPNPRRGVAQHKTACEHI